MSMSYETIYLAISVLVALMMLVESRILAKTEGRFFGHPVLSALSLLEFVWLVLAGFALFHLNFLAWTIVVPVIYVFYNVFAWIYGMHLFRKEGLLDKVAEDGEAADLAIPKQYRDFSLSFAMVFLVLSIAALVYQIQYH